MFTAKTLTCSIVQVKCSACGGTGHMRSNKLCPKYQETLALIQSGQLLPEADESSRMSSPEKGGALEDENLINVEGTKIKISKQLVEMHAIYCIC